MAGRISKILKQRIFLIAFIESKQINRISAQIKSLVALAASVLFLIVFSIVCGILSVRLLKQNYQQAQYIQELKSSLLQYSIQEAPPIANIDDNMTANSDTIPSVKTQDTPVTSTPAQREHSSIVSLEKKDASNTKENLENELGVKIIDILAVQSSKPNQTRMQFTLQRVANNARKGTMLGTVCLAAYKKGTKTTAYPPEWLSPHTSTFKGGETPLPCDGGVSVKFNHLRPIDLPIPTDLENIGSVVLVYKDVATGMAITQHHELAE